MKFEEANQQPAEGKFEKNSVDASPRLQEEIFFPPHRPPFPRPNDRDHRDHHCFPGKISFPDCFPRK